MKKKKLILLNILGLLLFFSSQSCIQENKDQQKTPEKKGSFIEYYHHLNLAIDAKNKNDLNTRNKEIWKAFEAHPTHNEVPIPEWLSAKLLNNHLFKTEAELIDFMQNNPVYYYKKDRFLDKLKKEVRVLAEQHLPLIDRKEAYHPRHEELKPQIDTIKAIDQYVRGNQKNVDTSLVPAQFKPYQKKRAKELVAIGDKYVSAKLLELHKEFGLFGQSSCKNCNISALYVHLDNYNDFLEMEDHLLELLHNGYLTANEYAWIYDRSYNEKHETLYYYFSLNAPHKTANYKPVKELTKEETNEINTRRAKIGLPPLPFDFTFLADYVM